MARKTIENFLERALRLYEQEPGERRGTPRLESYVTRWRRWATAGVVELCRSLPMIPAVT